MFNHFALKSFKKVPCPPAVSLLSEQTSSHSSQSSTSCAKHVFFLSNCIKLHPVTAELWYGWMLTLGSVQRDSCSHHSGCQLPTSSVLYLPPVMCIRTSWRTSLLSLCACGKHKILGTGARLSNHTSAPLTLRCLLIVSVSRLQHRTQIYVINSQSFMKH